MPPQRKCRAHPDRPGPHAGPRCATCHRERRAELKEKAWAARILATYQLTAKDYWRIYEAQGGTCYICQRATGKAKRLAVDHDHRCCPTTPTCGMCTRGLLCGTDNKLLGHARDSAEFFERAATYLSRWPSREVLYEPAAA